MQNVTANTIRNCDYKLFLFIMNSSLSIQREKKGRKSNKEIESTEERNEKRAKNKQSE